MSFPGLPAGNDKTPILITDKVSKAILNAAHDIMEEHGLPVPMMGHLLIAIGKYACNEFVDVMRRHGASQRDVAEFLGTTRAPFALPSEKSGGAN